MNVSTLVISADEARLKLDQNKRIKGRQRTLEDNRLESPYTPISRARA
jgi:hypothetical protein